MFRLTFDNETNLKFEHAKEVWSIGWCFCNVQIADEQLIETHPKYKHYCSYKIDIWKWNKRIELLVSSRVYVKTPFCISKLISERVYVV